MHRPQEPKKKNAAHLCTGSLARAVFAAPILLLHVGVQASAVETGGAAAVLRGTVTDAASGAPAACAVAVTDASGRTLTQTEAFKGGFRCGGTFDLRLPAGRTRVRVTRGFETRAVTREIDLRPGETTTVEVALERVVELRERGWVSGDSHAHMIHGERTLPVTFDFVALSARSEGLSYFSLAHDWQMEAPTPEKLGAELARHSVPGCALTWNLEAPKNYYKGDAGRCLGHCWTLGLRGRTAEGADVIPLLLQASAGDYQSEKPTFANFESHALIRAQGGAVFYTHPLRWWTGPWGGQGGYPRQERMRVSNMAAELPLDTVLGPTYDGLDVLTSGGEAAANDKAFQLWALLLNHGYRVAATASSDACFDRPGGAVPGSARTYTFIGTEPFSFGAVARATAAGRTFATTGPLLVCAAEGCPPGSALPADGKEHVLNIEAWASGKDSVGLKQAEIFRNGQPYQSVAFAAPQSAWQTNLVLRETEAAWYCVRLTGGPQGGRAVSGAFFFDPAPHRPPSPAACRVRVRVVDAADGRALDAAVTEVLDSASAPRDGARHALPGGQGALDMAGALRLRAEAPGYAPLCLSPVMDSPGLFEALARFEEKDLLSWATYERLRVMLGNLELVFKLRIDKSKGAHGVMSGGAKAQAARPDERIDLIVAEKAAAFLAQQTRDKPFFLYLAWAAPHTPVNPAPEFRGTGGAGLYGDFIQQLDHCVGLVLGALEKQGLAQNTLVLFTSDNGAVLTREALDAGHRANGALLGQKTDAWEGGHRVPLIARWPGRIPAATLRKALFTQVDLMATCAEAAGVALPAGSSPDGASDWPAFLDPESAPAKRTEALFQGTGGHALRQGDWAYYPKQGSCGMTVQVPPGPQWGQPYAKLGLVNSDVDAQGRVKPDAPAAQLYNLKDDPAEALNVIGRNPEVAQRLAARLDALVPPKRSTPKNKQAP